MKQKQNDKVLILKKQDTKMSQASASLWEKNMGKKRRTRSKCCLKMFFVGVKTTLHNFFFY